MLTSKSFVKKTRRGGVIKIVREHYLRDDIWCGSEACGKCSMDKPVLSKEPSIDNSLCGFPHYLLPDTNVVLHQVDILEDEIIKNVILLQTVQKEVKHRSLPAYKRIRDIIANSNKQFYVFTNEHHRDTYVEIAAGESANDFNDRAIRKCVEWYNKHLKQSCNIKVVLLTNDIANRDKAREEGQLAYTVGEYVKALNGRPELVDRLAQINSEERTKDALDRDIKVSGGKKILFPEHLSLSQLQAGIKEGRYKQGTFQSSRENYREGYVSVQGEEKRVFIKGLANQNRAVQDDIIAIEMLPESQWSAPSSVIAEDTGSKDDVLDEAEDSVDSSNRPPRRDAMPTCRVVGIIKRNWRPFCGVIMPASVKGGTRHLFMAAERRIPKIRIETRQYDALVGHRIIVSIDSWPRNSRYPLGHFVRSLGKIGDKDTENEVLLLEHDVPHLPFSEAVLSFLPKMPWTITEEDEAARVDLRHIDICSVDPPGCTDIDDALHYRPLENGNAEVGVHIADVSHFIKPGNALDAEARLRGTTVYLVDRRIDMVPDLLSSNLCSLRGGEERFAFSTIWEMTPGAEIVNVRFHKSIIRSRAAFTYEEAQLKIDDRSQNDALAIGLRGLNRMAKILKQRRIDNGALTLASSEIRFSMDSETHDPIEVERKVMRETNSMVEEFMLLANISVAERIRQEFPQSACLRRHPVPPPSNFEPLIKVALTRGFELQVDSGKALADSLDKAELPDIPFFNQLLRMMTTRCMTQALYFSSGMLPEKEYLHYGLASPIYTHFTSPIRRYSDVIVHRMLAVAISADTCFPELLNKTGIQEICDNLNYRHRMAQYAGRASVDLHTQIFFKDRVVDEDGYVIAVRKNALQIFIPKFGLEGTLYVQKIEDGVKTSLFTYNDEEPSQNVGDVKLRAFDHVTVQISMEATSIQHQKLALKLVSPHVPGFSVPSQTSLEDNTEEEDEPPTKKRKTSPT
ncbi:exosome complex exonuclease RRP44-like [Diadema antillarum]|uniref:exosome complex exonuclease RRP44-like n=1 Tax=Diadema antillarum TaxID=105358 RepID=UPI003A87F21F